MNNIVENQYFVEDNMGDPYPGETGIYAVEDEVVLYPGSALYRGQ